MPSEGKSRFQSNWRGLFAPTLLGLRNPNRYYLSGWNGSIILLRRSQELSLQCSILNIWNSSGNQARQNPICVNMLSHLIMQSESFYICRSEEHTSELQS